MTEVVIVLEHAPTPQQETRRLYHGGQMTIGRGDDADWRIEDPDMFVSRKHCVISDDTGMPTATDASTGGLFVDGAATPLGAGNSRPLENDMRLRMGDFVFRVEMASTGARPVSDNRSGLAFSFDFGPAPTTEPVRERPRDLPAPFGVRPDDRPSAREDAPRPPPRPFDDRDPFALDLAPRRSVPEATPVSRPAAGGGQATDPPGHGSVAAPSTPAALPLDRPLFGGPAQNADPAFTPPSSSGTELFGTGLGTPQSSNPPPSAPVASPASSPSPAPPPAAPSDAALRAAFYRGLGVAPSDAADAEAEMEALGRRFRALADGLVHLLRTRSKEKQKVRVAQTIVGAANVNPLKFAVAADDAVAALLAPRGKGYLAPDDAIAQSHRDLIDHQVRTWAALQAALRRMIDRFDPEEIERELEAAGRLQTLLSGGHNAKLWQLYVERYREIARAAEERFLGEVGADFRDAYEDKGRTRDDT